MRRVQKDKKTYSRILNKQFNWRLNRKQFIASLLAGGILSQIPFSNAVGKINPIDKQFNETQLSILKSVQEILFPCDGNGPGAIEINAANYLEWVLSDPNKDIDEVKYILDGIRWVDETAEEIFSKKYIDLEQSEKVKLVNKISKEGWGESWLSVILSFIFEALLCDPQYGGNPNSIGWEWLNYYAGQPRPSTDLLYPEIINTIHKL